MEANAVLQPQPCGERALVWRTAGAQPRQHQPLFAFCCKKHNTHRTRGALLRVGSQRGCGRPCQDLVHTHTAAIPTTRVDVPLGSLSLFSHCSLSLFHQHHWWLTHHSRVVGGNRSSPALAVQPHHHQHVRRTCACVYCCCCVGVTRCLMFVCVSNQSERYS